MALARFPLNFAFFAAGRAATIMKAHPEIDRWVLGGHSLGGAIAASWLHAHPDSARGLVLLASGPPDSADFSSSSLAVLSLSGTNDGLLDPSALGASRRLLPATARFIAIDGGNHANFGEYGPQEGDGESGIEGSRQRELVVETLDAFLRGLP